MQGAITAKGKQVIAKWNRPLNPNTVPVSQVLKSLLWPGGFEPCPQRSPFKLLGFSKCDCREGKEMHDTTTIWGNHDRSRSTKSRAGLQRRAIYSVPESATIGQRGDMEFAKNPNVRRVHYNFCNLSLLDEKTPGYTTMDKNPTTTQPENNLSKVVQYWAKNRYIDPESEEEESEEEKKNPKRKKKNDSEEEFWDSEEEERQKKIKNKKEKKEKKSSARLARQEDSQEDTEDEDFSEGETEGDKDYIDPVTWWNGKDPMKDCPYKQTDKYKFKTVEHDLPAVWFNPAEVRDTKEIKITREEKTNVKEYNQSYTWHHTVEKVGKKVIGQLVLTSLHEAAIPHVGGVGLYKSEK